MSTVKNYGSCQIYVRGTGQQFLTELVAATLGAQAHEHYSIRAGQLLFEIRLNPDAGLATDFIGWPLTIEVEADEAGPSLVKPVSRLLTAAWERGYDAVAACDFEDELPDLGGLPRYR